jgi:hypothetical protein
VAWLAGLIGICSIGVAAPAVARAETLSISFAGKATTGQPLGITARGVADGAHRLYVYADQSGYRCASDPNQEYNPGSGVIVLSSTAGDTLSAGGFTNNYTYTPASELFDVCAYLDDTPFDAPDVLATDAPAEDEVKKYLENQEGAQPTGSRTGTLPGAVEPLPYNPQIAKEYWERVEAEARSRREREQAAQAEHRAGAAVQCVVPALRGHSLTAARRLLHDAHCKLGRVTIRHGAHHGTLVVTRQSPGRGRKLRQGAAVSVTLGPRTR